MLKKDGKNESGGPICKNPFLKRRGQK